MNMGTPAMAAPMPRPAMACSDVGGSMIRSGKSRSSFRSISRVATPPPRMSRPMSERSGLAESTEWMPSMNASAPGQGVSFTAREWCARNGLHAAINASMFQEDLRTSVSLMKTRSHTNNRRLSKDMAILAFDRLDPGVPEVQIIDRECEDFGALRARYGSLVQSIRMVSCNGKNVWSPQARRFSIAAVGTDDAGRVLFVHSRSPRSVHDFINILLGLPLGLRRALYVEGGPEAQLFVRGGGREYEFVGSYENTFMSSEDNTRPWPVPNVIGVAKRTSGAAPAARP